MNIAFLCGSFEAGLDGVADYLLRLTTELSRLGHRCQIIALADRFTQTVLKEREPASGTTILRIPLQIWEAGDIRDACMALQEFSPDWISLQMVCYAYESRGLPIRSLRLFSNLRGMAQRHLMFHELWIGETEEYGLRERALGWLQKRLLLRLTRLWAPVLTHTSNPVYIELLRRNGLHASELPLIGNIPPVRCDRAMARKRLLEICLGAAPAGNAWLLAGVFGSVHPEWSQGGWLNDMCESCHRSGIHLLVAHIGRAGARGGAVLNALRERFAGRLTIAELGALPAADISQLLQGLDFGISTSPWSLIGKSSAAAVMLEHGLPVVVTRTDGRLRKAPTPEPSPHPLLFRFDHGVLEQLVSGKIRPVRPESESSVAGNLSADLRSVLFEREQHDQEYLQQQITERGRIRHQ